MDIKKLAVFIENEALQAELENIDDIEELFNTLKKQDPTLTEEEFRNLMKEPEGELSEDDLDEVAGGGIIKKAKKQVVNTLRSLYKKTKELFENYY